MVWALLALLGIPVWFIVTALLVIFRNRRHVKSNVNTFGLKTSTDRGWSRSLAYGRWESDVLLVRTGFPLLRVNVRQVSMVEVRGELQPIPKGFEESATELGITYSGGGTQSIAVATKDLQLARGPALPEYGAGG